MNQERFLKLAAKAGFNPHPDPGDVEGHLMLEKARELFGLACEESAQTAAAVFGADQTRITHADATARVTLAVRSLYTNDVLFALADPHYDIGLMDHLPVTRLRP